MNDRGKPDKISLISKVLKMKNRRGEQFGFQINQVGKGSKTKFIVGGWKVGESKKTKAIKLKPGKYYWRCPQNRTPWYGMIAE